MLARFLSTTIARHPRTTFFILVLCAPCTMPTACAEPVAAVAAPPRAAANPSPPRSTALPDKAWGIPRFFELTPASGDDTAVGSEKWLRALTERTSATDEGALEAFHYAEPDPSTRELRNLVLLMPRARPYHSNGQTTTRWADAPEAFAIGVERSRTFGYVTTTATNGERTVRDLKARFEYSGTNVQDLELVYDVEGTRLGVYEHKGLVPDLPVSFDAFTVFDRTTTRDDAEPVPISAASAPAVVFALGLLAPGARWTAAQDVAIGAYHVVYGTTASGEHYFAAAPLEANARASFGNERAILGSGATPPAAAGDSARDVETAALTLPRATQGLLLSAKVSGADAIGPLLEQATARLKSFANAMADLRAHGDASTTFLHDYAHAFVSSHRSQRDPRALMELPYGDAFYPSNVAHSSANVWYGSDQASALLGLVDYYRKTHDRTILDPIWGVTESSLEAMTPGGSVWMKRYDEMLFTTESDKNTGRADAFIDNGGVSVNFNHLRLVVRRGYERIAGVTWGAVTPVIDGREAAVDGGDYRFAIEEASLPAGFRTDQDALSVSRLFTRRDGAVRVRETASVLRGVPAATIRSDVTNTGKEPLALGAVRVGIGDFFHYGDGTNEIAQNRYGFSRVFEGVPLHVGFWMEGMPEPLWGDAFSDATVDVTREYEKYKPRFMVVFGYDKAQIYYLTKKPDAVLLDNALPGANAAAGGVAAKDGYTGWTGLSLRYDNDAKLMPGEKTSTPPVLTYTLWLPLYSADHDLIPDQLQSIAPLWTELVETVKDAESVAERDRRIDAVPDRDKAQRLRALLNTSIESDYAYTGMQTAWMQAADLFSDLAKEARSSSEARSFDAHARRIREGALRGAAFSLEAMTHLRNRFDLMPAFGIMRYYGFHVPVFDWAYEETHDPRYREAMLYIADRIAASEEHDGLQVTNPSKPNYGAFVINEFSRAAGANNLDDQGVKLWALRIAFERTGDAKYRRSAALCIDHWVKIRPQDHLFYGISKLFDRYVPTGLDQQRTPYGHYSLMVGLKAWADSMPRARSLYEEGLLNATRRHLVHAVGLTGAYYMTFPDEGMVHFGTNAELGGTFLWALTFDATRWRGRWGAREKPTVPASSRTLSSSDD